MFRTIKVPNYYLIRLFFEHKDNAKTNKSTKPKCSVCKNLFSFKYIKSISTFFLKMNKVIEIRCKNINAKICIELTQPFYSSLGCLLFNEPNLKNLWKKSRQIFILTYIRLNNQCIKPRNFNSKDVLKKDGVAFKSTYL